MEEKANIVENDQLPEIYESMTHTVSGGDDKLSLRTQVRAQRTTIF